MSDIDPVEFGKLCANVQATHDTVKQMNTKQEDIDDRVIDLEGSRDMLKKACKWVGGGITAIASFVAWVSS